MVLVDTTGRERVRRLAASVAVEAGLTLRPFRIDQYLAGLSKIVEIERWPRKIPFRKVIQVVSTESVEIPQWAMQPRPLGPTEVAGQLLRWIDVDRNPVAAQA